MQDAIEAVRQAQAQGAEMERFGSDLGRLTPDGAFVVRQSLRRHTEALGRLRIALEEFEAYTAARWGRTPKE